MNFNVIEGELLFEKSWTELGLGLISVSNVLKEVINSIISGWSDITLTYRWLSTSDKVKKIKSTLSLFVLNVDVSFGIKLDNWS